MPAYVLLMRNDAQGAARMLDAGQDGAAGQAKALDAYGATLIAQYGVMGIYDVVLIADFPDRATCYGFALDATAGGQYTDVLPALTPAEVGQAAARYGEVYKRLTNAGAVTEGLS
jgi:uncharacterized protein with GYD domain